MRSYVWEGGVLSKSRVFVTGIYSLFCDKVIVQKINEK